MSTRSIVGLASDRGGVYVHCDGYPEARLPILVSLIKNLGVEELGKILKDKGEWSSLNLDASEDGIPDYMDGRLGVVNEVGYYYTDASNPLLPFDDEEYGYALHPNGNIDVIDCWRNCTYSTNAFSSNWQEDLQRSKIESFHKNR